MKILKTILIGCAWCKKIIGFTHCETNDINDMASISHGMCETCSDKVSKEFGLDDDPSESKEKDEEELESESS